MVKIYLTLFLLLSTLYSDDIYERNCLSCHQKLPVGIDKYFYRYLLKYSSERKVKQALTAYLKNPSKENTIMPEAFVSRFGIKQKSLLSDKELNEAIDIYWEKYKVFGKLK